jgi:hypothetical protein
MNRVPLVCEYLRSGGRLASLLADYSIISKRHRSIDRLVLLKYNQIASPLHVPIVRECRGIILDESDNWRVVGRGFDKFFNLGEPHADPIDWSTARVQEKKDGSLCCLYEYGGVWRVSTTGTPDAGGDVNGSGMIFADYFWSTFLDSGLSTPLGRASQAWCFLFELTGPHNRIVVPHQTASLTLLAARNRETGEYMLPEDAARMIVGPVSVVTEFRLGDVASILGTFGVMSPLAQEGYVVVDGGHRRIKIKHPGYVALHHAKDGMSTKAFVEIARSGEVPEVIAAFPEFAPLLGEARGRLDALVADVERDYAAIHTIETQKDFALKATKTRCPAALFSVRAGKASSAREFFANVQIETLMRMLGYKSDRGVEVAS